jgi:hypothetical protein
MLTTEELIQKFPLGRNKSKPDFRDYMLASFIPKGSFAIGNIGYKCWNFPSSPLQQEGPWCVGFSGADWGICSPINDPFTNADGKRFYDKCKIVDGDKEDGSTVHSLAKVLKDEGLIDGYAFAGSVEEIKWWILNKGSVIVGTVWTEDMFLANTDNIIHPTGKILGGHAYLLSEYTKNGYFGIQNSWGNLWGSDPTKPGKAYISETDFKSLFIYDGEALAAVELEAPIKTNPFLNFIEMLLKIIIAGRK